MQVSHFQVIFVAWISDTFVGTLETLRCFFFLFFVFLSLSAGEIPFSMDQHKFEDFFEHLFGDYLKWYMCKNREIFMRAIKLHAYLAEKSEYKVPIYEIINV